MKICICTNTRPHIGGVTSYINSIVKGFDKLNYRSEIVSVFGVSKTRQVRDKFVKRQDDLLAGGNVKTILVYKLAQGVLWFNLFFNCLKKRYDVIYAIDISASNVSLCLKKIFKMPVVLNVQSSVVRDLLNQQKIAPDSLAYRFFLAQEKKAYSKVDLIIANSNYTRDDIVSKTKQPARIEISRNVIDEERFFSKPEEKDVLRRKLGLPQDKFVMLYPGRLVERKGVIYLALAVAELIKNKDDYYLVYAGGASESETQEKNRIMKIVKEDGLEDKVVMLGHTPNDKMAKLMRASDVILVPSVVYKGLAEPLGITALEAMASGVPLVASAIGGLKETIRHEYNGLLVPEKDAGAIKDAVERLRDNVSLRNNLVRNGLKEVEEKYTTLKVAEFLVERFKCIKTLKHESPVCLS